MTAQHASGMADLAAPAESPVLLELLELRKQYGTTTVLEHVDLAIRKGEFVCVVGPSGSGKTTLLRCMAGLLSPTSGETVFEGRTVVEPPARLAVVFQDYSRSLLPWMTIRQNIELPLRNKLPKTDRPGRVEEALAAVGLAGKGDLYPWQMSGGMQQRGAIARGLAYQPDVLLMDEPFAAVDAQTRAELEDLVLRVRRDFDTTIVFVTHDIDEAVYLGDRVVVLSGSPTTVAENIEVGLPAPRDQIATKELDRYSEVRARVFHLIRTAKPGNGVV